MSFTIKEQSIINQAISIIEGKLVREDFIANNVDAVKQFCQLQIGALEHEVFSVLFLDNKHRLIAFETMFRGTISASAVYPREVVKTALSHNAAAVIFTHNHPSGTTTPSQADNQITKRLQAALELVEIRILDHLIVSPISSYSFAQNGQL